MNEQEIKEQLKQEIKQEMKKSARKKRTIILLTIIVIVVVFFVFMVVAAKKTDELNKRYTYEEISKYKKEIPITTENWKEYVIAEDTTSESKDAFGKVISRQERTSLKLKDNIGGYLILELNVLKNKYEKKQIIIIKGGYDTDGLSIDGKNRQEGDIQVYNNRFTLDDLELVQLKGYIYTIDIPEEIWKTQKDTERKYILLKEENSNGAIYLYKDKLPEEADYISILSQIDYEKYNKQINE